MSMIGNFVAVGPAMLQGFLEDPSTVATFLYPDEAGLTNHLDVDKAWQGIHFLLTGDPWAGSPPLALAVLGGTQIGDDVGYGPARYLTPHQVQQVAGALAATSRNQLAAKYSPKAFQAAEIYPGIWEEDPEALDYLLTNYDALLRFYQQASSRGDAVLKYVN